MDAMELTLGPLACTASQLPKPFPPRVYALFRLSLPYPHFIARVAEQKTRTLNKVTLSLPAPKLLCKLASQDAPGLKAHFLGIWSWCGSAGKPACFPMLSQVGRTFRDPDTPRSSEEQPTPVSLLTRQVPSEPSDSALWSAFSGICIYLHLAGSAADKCWTGKQGRRRKSTECPSANSSKGPGPWAGLGPWAGPAWRKASQSRFPGFPGPSPWPPPVSPLATEALN